MCLENEKVDQPVLRIALMQQYKNIPKRTNKDYLQEPITAMAM